MLGDCGEKITNTTKSSGGKKAEIEAKIMEVPLFQDFPPDCGLEKAAGGPREPHSPESA